MILFLIVLLILVIYYLSYFIYSNRNILNINRLLKDRQIVPIASKPALLDKPLNEFYINIIASIYQNPESIYFRINFFLQTNSFYS